MEHLMQQLIVIPMYQASDATSTAISVMKLAKKFGGVLPNSKNIGNKVNLHLLKTKLRD